MILKTIKVKVIKKVKLLHELNILKVGQVIELQVIGRDTNAHSGSPTTEKNKIWSKGDYWKYRFKSKNGYWYDEFFMFGFCGYKPLSYFFKKL